MSLSSSFPLPLLRLSMFFRISRASNIDGLVSFTLCKHRNANSATAHIISLTVSSVSNPRDASTKSCNSSFRILLIAIVHKLISCLCLVISTAGFEDISSTNTTPKLKTSLLFVS
uniref:Uncharacterized protein n=1 Tax=Cucumis sativus TaxID=3659 RepID=A0A0A0LTP9_CUCSA